MADIVLLHPPVSFTAKHLENDIIPDCPPLGLLYLAAGLEKLGFTIRILDAIDGSLTLNDTIEFIIQEKPKLIGITAMTMNIKGAVQLAKAIKENYRDKHQLCLGGPHISADNDIIKRFAFFDFGVIGEADLTLPKIAKEIIHNNKKYEGIITAEVPMNLDNICSPARHLVDWKYYRKKRGFWANAIMATRGCPFGCIFCSIPAILRRYRIRDSRLVVKEMEEAYKTTNIETFVFIDDIFTLRRDFVIRLCQDLKKSHFSFRWEAQTKANLLDEKLLKEMKSAGCYKLLFGIESGSERIRNEIINKEVSDKEIQKANELCWKNGIEPDWYLMLGFPSETKKELYETVNFPLRIKPQPNIIGVHITTPLPGAPLFQQAVKDGIISEDIVDKYIKGELGEGYKDIWPYYAPKGLTLEDLKIARSQAYRKFYFRLAYFVKRLMRDFKSLSRLKKDIKQSCALLIYGRSADDK